MGGPWFNPHQKEGGGGPGRLRRIQKAKNINWTQQQQKTLVYEIKGHHKETATTHTMETYLQITHLKSI